MPHCDILEILPFPIHAFSERINTLDAFVDKPTFIIDNNVLATVVEDRIGEGEAFGAAVFSSKAVMRKVDLDSNVGGEERI